MSKRILFICPEFNNYEIVIKDKLEEKGFVVDLVIEKRVGFIFNLLFKFTPVFNFYFQTSLLKLRIFKHKKSNYSKIVIIRGEYVSKKVLSFLSKHYSKTPIVFYQWDSVKNNNISLEHIKEGYKTITFDSSDSKKYSIPYLPLFFHFDNCSKVICYDVSFVGSYTLERFDILCSYIDFCELHNLKYNFKIKADLIHFLKDNWRLLFDSSKYKYFSCIRFRSVKYENVMNDMNCSNVVLDICHPSQSGLTIRTVESIGLNKKIITNNNSVVKEVFYNKDMVYIFDIENIENIENIELVNFIKQYDSVEYNFRQSYSISNWVDELLKL